jgi:hydrogenase maturation factor
MSTKILEVAPSLGKWALLHNDVALATFETEDAAERAAHAIARTQPAGDDAEVHVLSEEVAAAI